MTGNTPGSQRGRRGDEGASRRNGSVWRERLAIAFSPRWARRSGQHVKSNQGNYSRQNEYPCMRLRDNHKAVEWTVATKKLVQEIGLP